jgi:predicted transcriptional regulator
MSETSNRTTIELPSDLKRRIQTLVEGTGQSMHAFVLEAIRDKAELAERRRAFVQDALEAEREFEKTGLARNAEDVHRYLGARLEGKRATRPRPKSCWK